VKRLFLRALLVLAGFAGLIIPAKAQAVDQIVVKIPFEFVAAGTTLPAGEYRISRLRDEKPRVLLLRSLDNPADVVTLATETADTPHGKVQLDFTILGDQHILSRIESSSHAYIISVPRTEGLLAATPKGGAAASSSESN